MEELEEPDSGNWGRYGGHGLVGHGKVTSSSCGKFLTFKGCLRVDLHDVVTLDGKNYKGKVYVRKVHVGCHKPTCPICYKSSWAVREAGNIESVLAVASKHFGKVEHIIASVPDEDYGLSLEASRKKVAKILRNRGVAGGCLIFHGFRYRNRDFMHGGLRYLAGWYWSPHFHVLGYIFGGYSRCRRCRKGAVECLACSGFEGRTRRLNAKDGYIVKVKDERKSIFWTAWYQLNHASVKSDAKRFHVATWFGVCSYRKLKVTKKKKKELCPICKHELVGLRYVGNGCFVLDRSLEDYKRETFSDFEEDGIPAWILAKKG